MKCAVTGPWFQPFPLGVGLSTTEIVGPLESILNASLVTDVCCEDELQVVCAPTHEIAKQKFVTAKMLMEHAYLSREPGSGTREVIDHYLQKGGLSPDSLQVVMEAGSPEALKGLVATGLGYAIMSRATVIKEIRLGELTLVPLSPRLTRYLSVVYPKERMHSRLVNSFVRFAKERLVAVQAIEGRAVGG